MIRQWIRDVHQLNPSVGREKIAKNSLKKIGESEGFRSAILCQIFFPLKTNISPENCWLEDDSCPFKMVPFLGDMFIFRGVYTVIMGKKQQRRWMTEPYPS